MPRFEASFLGPHFRDLRLAKSVTQEALAGLIGAKQSQISAFEGGDSAALSAAKIQKAAELLEVAPALLDAARKEKAPLTFCGGFDCPTQEPTLWSGRILFKPLYLASTRSHCRFCGDLMQAHCPCGAPVELGLNCPDCGRARVAPRTLHEIDLGTLTPGEWVQERRAFNLTLMRFSGLDLERALVPLSGDS